MELIISMENINKSYHTGENDLHVLKNVSLKVEKGEYLAILGPSGSGKSTLMNIIGCMDVSDEGTYFLDGVQIEKASEEELVKIRNQKIGFIFQGFNLLEKMTALENVELPMMYSNIPMNFPAASASALPLPAHCRCVLSWLFWMSPPLRSTCFPRPRFLKSWMH